MLGNAKVLIDSETALQLVKDLQTDTLPRSYRVFGGDGTPPGPMLLSVSNNPGSGQVNVELLQGGAVIDARQLVK